jgi:hypothetical protein
MKIASRRVALFAAAGMMLLPLVLGTSPLPPPYNEYVVSGTVLRHDGGPAMNVIVSLVGKWNNFADSVIDLRGTAIRYQSVKSVAVADANGRFTLDIQMEMKLDSLAMMVNALDKPAHISGFLPSPDSRDEIVTVIPAEMSGCHGCETVTPTHNYVSGYRYTLSVGLTVPY